MQADLEIKVRRPDMIATDKKNTVCNIIDFAVAFDKIEKYQDSARDLRKIWNTKVKAIPFIIFALGTTLKLLRKRLKDFGINTEVVELQKSAILLPRGSSGKFLRFEETCCHLTL